MSVNRRRILLCDGCVREATVHRFSIGTLVTQELGEVPLHAGTITQIAWTNETGI